MELLKEAIKALDAYLDGTISPSLLHSALIKIQEAAKENGYEETSYMIWEQAMGAQIEATISTGNDNSFIDGKQSMLDRIEQIKA